MIHAISLRSFRRLTHLREDGECLPRRPLAHPELREDVLKLLVVDDIVTFKERIILLMISSNRGNLLKTTYQYQ